MSSCKLELKGFDEVLSRLGQMGTDVDNAVEEALRKSHDLITNDLHSQMAKHHKTGETEASIVDFNISWSGKTAVSKVGFDIANGGLPSIFLMYGTPKMKKDTKLYNVIYGNKRKKELKELQKNILYEALARSGG